MMKILFIAPFCLLHQLSCAQGQDSLVTPLQEIVVVAQRQRENNLWVPYSVEKTDSLLLFKSNARTTPELLQATSGVFVQKTNHGGGSAIIRGLTGNQSLIMIDGIRLNNSTFRYGPNQYLNTIEPFIIDHVEVAKGTGSVQYGTDAMGGVIHILSKDPSFATDKSVWHGLALAKYTTGNMEKTGRVELGHATKRLVTSGGLTYRRFGDLVGGDTTGRQIPSGYHEFSLNGKLKYQLRKDVQLTLAHQTTGQNDVPIYHKVVLENFLINKFDPQKRQLTYARINMQKNSKLLNKIEFTTSLQHTSEGRESRKQKSNTSTYEKDWVRTLGVTLDVVSKFAKALSSNTGVELYTDKINSSRKEISLDKGSEVRKRGLYPDNALYNNFSIYSLHHFKQEKFAADAGVRFNTFAINLQDSTLGQISTKTNVMVWNAALTYRVYRQHFLYVTFSRGFRAPNIDDMGSLGIVDFRYEVPTNGLRPEKSLNKEIGYKFKEGVIKGDLAVYHMQLNDLITRVKVPNTFVNGYQVYQKENIEKAYIQGGEAEVSLNATRNVNVTGSICYTYGQNETNNEPLRRIPPIFGRSQVDVNIKSWIMAGEIFITGNQDRLSKGDKDDNRIPKGGTPGWAVVNFYLSRSFSNFKFSSSLNNILNKDYRIHGSGINGIGRSISLTALYSF